MIVILLDFDVQGCNVILIQNQDCDTPNIYLYVYIYSLIWAVQQDNDLKQRFLNFQASDPQNKGRPRPWLLFEHTSKK